MLSKRARPYDPEELSKSARLRRNLQDILSRNELPASRIAEICADVNRVAPAELTDVGRNQ